jgi:hypothetical protein
MFRARRELVAGPLVSSVATPCLPRGSNTCADRSHDHRGCRGGANPRWAAVDVDRGDAGQLQSGPRTRWCPGFSGYVRMRRAESLDVSSFAAQDACAAEQPPPAKRSPCRAGSPEAAPAYRSSRRDGGGGPWGVHAWTVNGCDARPRSSLACSSTISCGRASGLTNIAQGHPERGGDHARSGRCLRRVNHGARTAPRQGRG